MAPIQGHLSCVSPCQQPAVWFMLTAHTNKISNCDPVWAAVCHEHMMRSIAYEFLAKAAGPSRCRMCGAESPRYVLEQKPLPEGSRC